jgi:hypothetical protein
MLVTNCCICSESKTRRLASANPKQEGLQVPIQNKKACKYQSKTRRIASTNPKQEGLKVPIQNKKT